MKRIVTLLTGLSTVAILALPARADFDFGDFLLGTGIGVGTSLIINSINQSSNANRYAPVSPQQEYYRGVEDGTNRAKYDNPRNSPDYDNGYQVGLQRS